MSKKVTFKRTEFINIYFQNRNYEFEIFSILKFEIPTQKLDIIKLVLKCVIFNKKINYY